MIHGIHHVAVATNDADRLLAFYRDLIGFEVVADYSWDVGNTAADQINDLESTAARSIMLRNGNAYFEIFQYSSPEPSEGDRRRRVCDPGITHICLDVSDLSYEFERLSAAGMEFHCPPQNAGAGVKTTYGRDPDGNVVELQQIPSHDHPIALPLARAKAS
jgi:catechol 2,3-dioxygenase-like lactoylglutathione lyase family enzyme